MTDRTTPVQTQAQQIAVNPALPMNVQQAVLNLIAWSWGKKLTDHGYDVSADLKLVLEQFHIAISGPIAPTESTTADSEV